MTRKGWRRESARHSLAARGVRTKQLVNTFTSYERESILPDGSKGNTFGLFADATKRQWALMRPHLEEAAKIRDKVATQEYATTDDTDALDEVFVETCEEFALHFFIIDRFTGFDVSKEMAELEAINGDAFDDVMGMSSF